MPGRVLGAAAGCYAGQVNLAERAGVLARAARARRGLRHRGAGQAEGAGRPQSGAWGTGIFCQGAYPAWMYALLGGAKLLAISISVCAGAPVWAGSRLHGPVTVACPGWLPFVAAGCEFLFGPEVSTQVQNSWLTAAPPHACQGMLRAGPC